MHANLKGIYIMLIRTFLLLLILLSCPFASITFAGDGHAHGPDGSHISDSFQSGTTGNIVTLSHDARQNLGIETITIKTERLSPTKTLYGRIIADPRRVFQISAPFSGTVEKIFVLPGSFVSQDEELLRVKPIQVGTTATVLRAKRSGYVTDLHVASGQIFEPTDVLLRVSDLDVVLFEGDVFDLSDAHTMTDSTSCSVHTKRFSQKHFPCRVETVDATLKGNPPVGHVHASILNPNSELKPGMTGEIHLSFGNPTSVLTVPKSAVLGKFEKQFVYRERNGAFVRTYVRLGESYGDHREVLEGLSPGELIVVQGHYQLQHAKSDTSTHEDHEHGDHEHGDHEHGDHEHGDHEHSH
jgi:multidrug efflux pump subunit AcrA (membrane-fusion protein)